MLEKFLDVIYLKSPLQKKRLTPFLSGCDATYWRRANTFADRFERYLDEDGLSIEYVVDAYLKMCGEMLALQTRFLRSGTYVCSNQGDAYSDIYSNQPRMRAYMLALVLSTFLWKNHYYIYSFYLDVLEKHGDHTKDYLEIGPGHGLFLSAAMDKLGAESYTAIDISRTSLEICSKILPYLCDLRSEPQMVEQNAMEIAATRRFDFITMGEVIEHLDDPKPLLKKISEMLGADGYAFLTTCANCPAVDHVYLFRNVQEIRELFHECGLVIEEERALAVEDVSPEDLERQRIGINYAALVKSNGR